MQDEAALGDGDGRTARQGDADRQHDPPAARGGEVRTAGRRQPAAAAQHPPGVDHELKQGLAPELGEELDRITLPFSDDSTPTDAELRIAQAQLVGWLEGLFHGIQTALFAQQMAARAQLEQMRRALPPGHTPEGSPPASSGDGSSGGMYL